MLRIAFLSAAFAFAFAFCGFARAEEARDEPTASDRLLIVNGNTGRVVYDDGRDDLFCVTRKICVGYTSEGRPIFRRTMVCR